MYINAYIVPSIRELISTHPFYFYFRFTSGIHNVCFVILLLLVAASNVWARPQRYAHIAVIENEAYEESLPNALRNPFYKTPRVREALAKSSWFGPGEEPVVKKVA